MIYTPSKHPKQAVILVSLISMVGIVGGLLFSRFFFVFALLFWMKYTAVLSYLQFREGKKHKVKGITGILLKPQIRFFTFEFLAALGLFGILKYDWYQLATAVLIAWFLFSINFYRHYKQYKEYE